MGGPTNGATRRTLAACALLVGLGVIVTGAAFALGPDGSTSATATAPPAGHGGHSGHSGHSGHGEHAGHAAPPLGTEVAERHTGPQGRFGQFVVKCTYSHTAPDDPIVHPGAPGRSHSHDFYGSTATDASSTAESLLTTDTTCDKKVDTAAYWQPTLFNRGVPVTPSHINAYYRAAPGVDPTTVVPFPLGIELLAGDPTATTPQPGEVAGWVCGAQTNLRSGPPDCSDRAPLHMVLTFPDCWDGEQLRTADHRSHAAYSRDGRCPESHPVVLPQLTMAIAYPIGFGDHELSLASGNVYSAHGDFLNAWDPEGQAREVTACIVNDVVCDLASNRDEDGPFLTE